MRHVWPAWLALLWLVLLPATGLAAEAVALPALNARVTDLTATLDPTQRGRLEAQLAAIERSGRAQIAVVLLPTTAPEAIEQFGIRLADAWKIGHKGADNGVIVIVAKDDRKMRIEVGYGLEGAVPDAIASRIVNERMAPAFRQGDFFGGLQAAVAALDQATGGSGAGVVADTPLPVPVAVGENWIEWLFMVVIGAGVLRKIFGLLGSFVAAAVAGWLGYLLFGSLGAAGIAALLVFLLSFLKMTSGVPGRGGGFDGGGGGFSGGGGGFSGGGGGFGGGGASGRW